MICPCRLNPNKQSLLSVQYADCCQPLHTQQQKADTAEQLMRSRYSAFVLVNVDYIIATTVPAQQAFLDKSAIASWAEQTSWQGLEILNHIQKIGQHHAQVEFKAYYNQEYNLQAHHELSTFVQIKQKQHSASWYFLDPTLNIKVPQKQPCICGSGKKFKRCCGQFL